MSTIETLCTLFLAALLWPLQAWGDGPVPQGPFSQAECLQCHADQSPELVSQWRNSPHGGTACVACHGDRHGRLPSARRDAACSGCHGGVVEHSYASSKHGVIVTLQQERDGWPEPLERGNYRAPGCAYCHQHAGDHGDTMDATRGRHVREWVCSGCHAPRYVADQFTAGSELLEIGRLKAAEAEGIAGRHPEGPAALTELMEQVSRHLRNLRLGAGHQSPDYQWWHGQPALDGDLIRFRDAVARAQRRFRYDSANSGEEYAINGNKAPNTSRVAPPPTGPYSRWARCEPAPPLARDVETGF